MTRRGKCIGLAALTMLVAAVAFRLAVLRNGDVSRAVDLGRKARIYPDYAGVTIPPNIAPLNFQVQEPGRRFHVRISGDSPGAPRIEIDSRDGTIRIPAGPWRQLLRQQRDKNIAVAIYARSEQGWRRFTEFTMGVALEPIDPYVVYRLIPPIYTVWRDMGLYQRDLEGFDERRILHNRLSAGPGGRNAQNACFNCHTFMNYGTDKMVLHVRPSGSDKSQQPGMILVQDGRAQRVETRRGRESPAAYVSWHPTGRYLAFSRNKLSQFFHLAGPETRGVIDSASDLGLYLVSSGETVSDPLISRPDRLDTFPSWSPDGKWLYFCSAPSWSRDPRTPISKAVGVRYDVMRIEFDPANGRFGRLETVVSAEQMGKSMSLPRVSPDGRFLMFCVHDYGSFPIYQPGSDLYLVDLSKLPANSPALACLASGEAAPRRLELNSDLCDSYHSWSSNSRWVIFSSKREDGVFARLYISRIDEQGRSGKPLCPN